MILTLIFASPVWAQISTTTHVKIVRAEDARAFDITLEDLMLAQNAAVQMRAMLAAGRIGSEKAIPALEVLLESDPSTQVRAMAAFALGEIESIKSADVMLKILLDSKTSDTVRARLVEGAGKIAAANAKDEKAKAIGETILDTLDAEDKKGAKQSRDVILQGITAALRTRPNEVGVVLAKFLTNLDPRIRADAANAIARLRAKNANPALRAMLMADGDAVARANAARALGAAEDMTAFNLLLDAATTDDDSRVRISAIRSLATLKNASAADQLLKHAEMLLAAYKKVKKPNFIPNEHSEFLEVAVTLGRLLTNSRNERAINLFREFGKLDRGQSAEVYIARLRVAPGRGDNTDQPNLTHWRQYSTLAQLVGEFASLEPTTDEGRKMKTEAPEIIRPMAKAFVGALDPKADATIILAAPDALRAFARFKTSDLAEVLRTALKNDDVVIRSTAAGLLADLPSSKESIDALKTAFDVSLVIDVDYNDAQLAILDALHKLDKKQSVGVFLGSLHAQDYLVRKKAFELLADKDFQKDFPNVPFSMENARKEKKDQVLPYGGVHTKLGQVLNTAADYRRAATRKNGTVKAVLTTVKGTFTIDLFPENAPLTVDNFIKLARANYFNGLEVHRVVPNFVMQDGDPRGDGSGGPGWSIRCEVNMLAYDRGAVGMALSGKDTGGSQWFVTHSPQPHLDGGYTVFGRVNETGMKVVDNIVRGDKILSVRIVEGGLTTKTRRTQRK